MKIRNKMNTLPSEIIQIISYYLNPRELLNFRKTNIYIDDILSDHIFIKNYTDKTKILFEAELDIKGRELIELLVHLYFQNKINIDIKKDGLYFRTANNLCLSINFIHYRYFKYYYFQEECTISVKNRDDLKPVYNSGYGPVLFTKYIDKFEISTIYNRRFVPKLSI